MNNLIEIYNLLDIKYKKKVPVFIFLTLISTLFEIISIGLIVPLISSLLNADIIIFESINLNYGNFNFFLLLLFATYLIKTIYLTIFNKWQFDFIFSINHDLSNRLFKKYIHFDYFTYIKKNSSELVRNIINVENFSQNIYQSVVLVSEIILIFSFALILILFQPLMTLLTISIGLLLAFVFLKIFNPKLVESGEIYQNKAKTLIKEINQSINNFKDIKIYQKQNFFLNEFAKSTKVYSNSIKINEFFKSLPRIFIEFFAISIVLLIIFFMSVISVEKNQIITFVALFAAIGFRLIPSLNKIIAAIQHLKYYLKLTNNLSSDINLINKNLTINEKIDFVDKIELKNISYSYDDKKIIFKNLSLKIKKNKIIGIKGKTGSGKSTLINIIIGLLSPTSGSIIVDGKETNLNNEKWFNKIGYVPQRIMLSETSIKNNIIFGVEEDKIDEKKLNFVVNLSQLDNFIRDIGGIDKKINELGKNISGGQIQRIGIARALYNDPEILILDESTNNLDKETEENFIKSIKKISESKTVIIISHDTQPLEICDEIYEINEISES